MHIYDIANKLGLATTTVLEKAKELGIKSARVPSSNVDKITGEYIEEQLRADITPIPESQTIHDVANKLGLATTTVLEKAKELGIQSAKVSSSKLETITGEYLVERLREDKARNATQPTPASIGGERSISETAKQTGVPVSRIEAGRLDNPKSKSPKEKNEVASTLPQEPDQPTPQQCLSKSQPSKTPPSVIIRTTSSDLHSLLNRILTDEISFIIEVSPDEGFTPLRAKLVLTDAPATTHRASVILDDTTQPTAIDESTKDLFRSAYFAARHLSKDVWVNMAEFGSALKKQDPTFKPQKYGERSLGGLIRRMKADFDIKADDHTPPTYYIQLKSNASNNPTQIPTTQMIPKRSKTPLHRGTGRIHNLKNGFGFILPDDGTANLFFHSVDVVGCTIFDLCPGDSVDYEAGINEKGPCAYQVRRNAVTAKRQY